MHDMLVRLYDLPDLAPYLARQSADGIDIRRPLPAERQVVVDWVLAHFDPVWSNECKVAFANQPVSCFIAVDAQREAIVGFSCYEVVYKDFFGPIGVLEAYRGRDIGAALLLACLHAMHEMGYAYAIIAGVGPTAFYARVVGAVDIAGSTPGVYRGVLWDQIKAQARHDSGAEPT